MEKYNCLIVDDEHPALALLDRFVSKVPHLNLKGNCENGMEALTMLQRLDIDLIFLDIQMPDMTGIQLLESLSTKPQIILTTAYREFAVKSYEMDVTDYLIKPFSFERFLQAVNKAIEQMKRISNKKNDQLIELNPVRKENHFFVKSNGKF